MDQSVIRSGHGSRVQYVGAEFTQWFTLHYATRQTAAAPAAAAAQQAGAVAHIELLEYQH